MDIDMFETVLKCYNDRITIYEMPWVNAYIIKQRIYCSMLYLLYYCYNITILYINCSQSRVRAAQSGDLLFFFYFVTMVEITTHCYQSYYTYYYGLIVICLFDWSLKLNAFNPSFSYKNKSAHKYCQPGSNGFYRYNIQEFRNWLRGRKTSENPCDTTVLLCNIILLCYKVVITQVLLHFVYL